MAEHWLMDFSLEELKYLEGLVGDQDYNETGSSLLRRLELGISKIKERTGVKK